MLIRGEVVSDLDAIFRVNASAFESNAEAELVDALREHADPLISLVADSDGDIVGHILFSPVILDGFPELRVMGLAPMAVLPDRQGQGVGSALVREGLACCREMGFTAVVVLGHPAYYPRFGFLPASRYGIRSEYDAPDEAFMALELIPGVLADVSALARFHLAFQEL